MESNSLLKFMTSRIESLVRENENLKNKLKCQKKKLKKSKKK